MKITNQHILFNSIKHHFQTQIKLTKEPIEDNFYNSLLTLGGSQMDVYLGKLNIDTIEVECLSQLEKLTITDYNRYVSALHLSKGYFSVTISDKSAWVFRLGNDPDRFAHIHPGRYSPHTKRIRASNLKTVLALLAECVEKPDLETVNDIRSSKLDLSPIKQLEENSGILALWKFYSKLYHSTEK